MLHLILEQHQPTPTRTFSANQFNNPNQYDNNLLTPQQSQTRQFQNQHSMEYNNPHQNNQFSSNQLVMQQQHPSIDPITGQKINNESKTIRIGYLDNYFFLSNIYLKYLKKIIITLFLLKLMVILVN